MAAASCQSCLSSLAGKNLADVSVSARTEATLGTTLWKSASCVQWRHRAAQVNPLKRKSEVRRNLEVEAISSNEFRPGVNIELDAVPYRVQEFLHVKPGKGAAFVRTKLKNLLTGNNVERTFRAGENVDEAYVVKDVKQYTYADGDQYVFMDMATFEESRLDAASLGEGIKWLKEGMECNVITWREKVIDIELPINVKLLVTQTDPGIKGDTASGGGSKPCVVETGVTIQVPLFINEGDSIVVDTRTGLYMNRVAA